MPEIFIDCPSCMRKFHVAEEMPGREVKCPDCGHRFAANSASESQVSSGTVAPVGLTKAVPETEISSRVGPADETDETEPCPYCDDPVPWNAIYCPSCGEFIDEQAEDDRPWERPENPIRRDCEPHRGTLILSVGIVSLVFFPFVFCCGALAAPLSALGLTLGIAAWVMGNRDLKKIAAKEMDPAGRGATQAGKVCGIVGTGLGSLGILIGLALLAFYGFMAFRAIPNYRTTLPPQTVKSIQQPDMVQPPPPEEPP